MNEKIAKAKEYFYNKNYQQARDIFIQEKEYYEAGLCCLLLQDKKEAQNFFKKNKKNCLASQWGLCVLKFIDLKMHTKPTFFQTRAFLEVYLNLFLENNLIEWSENLLSSASIFASVNPESYKFIARALYANGYFALAITFCKQSLRIFFADPEALLILAQCQFLLNDLAESLDTINRLCAIVDDYYPALLFKKILKEEMTKKK